MTEIPDITLASCQYGDHRRSDGPNTFAAALVRAGVVSLRACRCEWCTEWPNAIGAHGAHEPEGTAEGSALVLVRCARANLASGQVANAMSLIDEAIGQLKAISAPPEGTIRADEVPCNNDPIGVR